MNELIRVVLADDHPLVRAGIRAALADETDLHAVGEAANGFEAQRLCRELQPDVLVLDLSMPGPLPLEVMSAVRAHCPALKVLVLSAYDDDAYVWGVVGAGAVGYLLKDEAPDVVMHAIRTVMEGGTWFSRPVAAKLRHAPPQAPGGGAVEDLTSREREVLEAVARGWDNARIAAEVHLAEQTVRNAISRIYAKLGVCSRAEALLWAQQHDVHGA
jgi:DNA-binding NarL/FixJ family response regulator